MPSNCSDNVFGPAVSGSCRDGFDFTLLFEQTILSILPAVAFLVVSPLRIKYLLNQDIRTRSNSIRIAKLVIATGFAAAQLALLILWITTNTYNTEQLRTRASIPAAVLNFIVGVHLVLLSWIEDSRSVRPSSLVNIYLLFTLVFDASQARTLWLQQQDSSSSIAITSVFSVSLGLKAVFLLLEIQEKRGYLQTKYNHLPPESTSGIINRSFMWWLNRLFVDGFRSLLTLNDLNGLDEDLHSSSLSRKVRVSWQQQRKKKSFARRFGAPLAVLRALWRPFVTAVIPRLCLIGFTFAQPFLIEAVLDWFNKYKSQHDDQLINKGYGLLGATALIYLGLAISNLHYNHAVYRFITMLRGAVSTLIYDHALHIPDGSLEDRSAAITLMTTDIDRICSCIVTLNECWARSIELGIGISLLGMRMGWVCIVPVATVLVCGIGSMQIAKRIGNRQKIWVDAVQNRIAITTSMLTNIQTIRRMGWSKTLAKIIQERQTKETRRMAGYRWSIVWQNVIQNLPWALGPALTFAVYTALQGKRDSLTAADAFTNLSIITLLTDPAAKLLSAVPSTAASLGCFDRIQEFLLVPGSHDDINHDKDSVGEEENSDDSVEMGVLACKNRYSQDAVITVKDVSILPVTSSSSSPSRDNVILQNVNFTICRGSFVFVIGEVGSGKTTLLRAILGHAVRKTGTITAPLHDIAYCAQVPWLPNVSIRAAICGLLTDDDNNDNNIDINWYQTVLHSCALEQDLKVLEDGDKTRIGSGSSAVLSGGQMQRVALARAIYSRRRVLLLDDCFSALDNATKKWIVVSLFGKGGLLRKLKSTVMLVTNETEHLSYADQILILSKGDLRMVTPSTKPPAIDGHNNSPPPEVEINDAKKSSAKEKSAQISKENQISDLTRATGDVTVYKYYLQSIGWVNMLVFLLFATVHVFCSTFSQIWLEWWSNRDGAQKGLYVSVYFILALFNSVGNGGYVWAILVLISPSTSRKLHSRLLKSVMRASSLFLSTTDSGVILNRFSQDMSMIEGQLPIGMLIFVSNLFMSIATAGLVASGSGYMTITIPFLLLALVLLQHFYLRTSRQLRLLDLESKSPLYTHFMETVSGLSTIQAFQWQSKFRDRHFELLDASQKPYYLLYCIQRWLTLVLDLIVAAEAVVLVGLAVRLGGELSVGLIGVSLNSILSFSGSLSAVTQGWAQLEISLGSISRVREFEVNIKPEQEISEKIKTPPADWPGRGEIEFKGMSSEYSPGNNVLHDISFKVQPGQKIGICGRTGSGKSSLLSTLLGILEITEGSLSIDGIDITTIPRETLRERLITIPQNTLILESCSIRLNADPAGIHTDTEIISALDRVGLWKDVLDRGHESGSGCGLDAEMSDTTLSKGQQQLFGLARALLKITSSSAKKILLLDEPTSNVDHETDAKMQSILRETLALAACTTLTVAHRIGSIAESSDVVLVLDGGRVVEMGDPRDLISNSRSVFREILSAT